MSGVKPMLQFLHIFIRIQKHTLLHKLNIWVNSLGWSAHTHQRPDGLNSVWCQQQKKIIFGSTHSFTQEGCNAIEGETSKKRCNKMREHIHSKGTPDFWGKVLDLNEGVVNIQGMDKMLMTKVWSKKPQELAPTLRHAQPVIGH